MKKLNLSKIYVWLIICNICIFAMIVIGAITRLTESGLSMVEWKPLIGAVPPLSHEEWEHVFGLYKQTPEFQKKNFWMEIDDFKRIFFWEWLHRLWGRMIGIVYGMPFLFFLIKGWIPQGFRLKLLGIFLLGGLQGYMGWYMVQSGLVNEPAVSHYRLAAHLAIALLIYSLIVWNILDIRQQLKSDPRKSEDSFLYSYGWLCLGLVILTIFWGAYTAGLDAGLVYNDTFPKMGQAWLPSEIWFYKPFWVNFFENHAGVQFVHRWLAMTTALVVSGFGILSFLRNKRDAILFATGGFVLVQLSLGILTLLSGVNIVLAVLHQSGAVILLTLILCSLHAVRPARAFPVK